MKPDVGLKTETESEKEWNENQPRHPDIDQKKEEEKQNKELEDQDKTELNTKQEGVSSMEIEQKKERMDRIRKNLRGIE